MKLSKTQRSLSLALVVLAAGAGFAAAEAAEMAPLANGPAIIPDPAKVVNLILASAAPHEFAR